MVRRLAAVVGLGQVIRTAMVFGLSLLLTFGCGSSRSSKDASPNWGDVAIPQVAKSDIGNQVFDELRVESYYLTFSDEEYAKLTDLSTILVNSYTVNEDRYVQAALKVGDTELPAIGVSYGTLISRTLPFLKINPASPTLSLRK